MTDLNFEQFVPTDQQAKQFEKKYNKVSVDEKSDLFDEQESIWLWNQAPISQDQIDKKYKAFVYLITNKINKKRYIGFKTLVSPKSTYVNHKKKKIEVNSDWETYWSSSEQLVQDVIRYGTGNFIREIVCFTTNKSVGKYYEAKMQFERNVVEQNADLYYNGIINLRLNHNSILKWNQTVFCNKPLLGDIFAEQS